MLLSGTSVDSEQLSQNKAKVYEAVSFSTISYVRNNIFGGGYFGSQREQDCSLCCKLKEVFALPIKIPLSERFTSMRRVHTFRTTSVHQSRIPPPHEDSREELSESSTL
jgi:hypothetical protein